MRKTKFSRTMLVSVLALAIVLSVTGGTIAWFTDEVTSANNIIKSGNLDVELQYSTDMQTWNNVETTTKIFKEDALWEPGYTEVVYLRVSNEGSLALKYQMGVSIVSETPGVNKAGEEFLLSDYIYFGAVETDTAYEGRPAARAAVTDGKKISEGIPTEGNLIAGAAADTLALVVYMPETVGNEANHQAGSQPSITLGLSVLANQDTVEKDAFDDQYDAGAPAWTGNIDIDWYLANPSAAEFEISTAEELAGLAAIVNGTAEGVAKDSFSSQTIKLTANIDLGNQHWTPIGATGSPFSGTFDGQGNTVHNLYIKIDDNRDSVGFFGYAANAKIKGLTIENADINAHKFVGTIVGNLQVGNITDCHVKGDISVVARLYYAAGIVGEGYYSMEGCSVIAEGVGKITAEAVAGGLCGRINEGTHSIKNCIVKNLDVQSGEQTAAITGFLHYGNTITGCVVENVNLTLTALPATGEEITPVIGLASGLWYYNENAVITISDNTFKNITISAKADVTGTTDILYGWEWNAHLEGIVEFNNTKENITNNLKYI